MQKKYWKQLHDLLVQIYYLERYINTTDRINRRLNIFVAISTSSSVAGWVVWQEYSFIWALIIASSSIITAIGPYLPYSSRLKALFSTVREFESLFVKMENDWLQVSNGSLTEKEINQLITNYKKQKLEIEHIRFEDLSIPPNQEFMNKAKNNAKIYLQDF